MATIDREGKLKNFMNAITSVLGSTPDKLIQHQVYTIHV